MARDHAAPYYQGNGPGLWGPLLRKGTVESSLEGTAGEVSWARRGRGASPGARFALAKFRPTTLPATLVTRYVLHDQLTAGASQRLTGCRDGRAAADTAGHRDHDGGALALGCASGSAGGHRRLQRRPRAELSGSRPVMSGPAGRHRSGKVMAGRTLHRLADQLDHAGALHHDVGLQFQVGDGPGVVAGA